MAKRTANERAASHARVYSPPPHTPHAVHNYRYGIPCARNPQPRYAPHTRERWATTAGSRRRTPPHGAVSRRPGRCTTGVAQIQFYRVWTPLWGGFRFHVVVLTLPPHPPKPSPPPPANAQCARKRREPCS